MGFLDGIGTVAFGYIVPFLFVLTIVVFFHELGHFLVARWAGVKVQVFSVGFGRELVGFTDRRGTRWRISLVPLGGYVRFLDDDNSAGASTQGRLAALTTEERQGAFRTKSVGRRAAIVAAGPLANFVLAILIFAALFAILGRVVTEPRVDVVGEGSPAAAAGFMPGDTILAVDGHRIEDFADVQRAVSLRPEEPIRFTVAREGGQVDLVATPERREVTDDFGNTQRIGVLGIQHQSSPDEFRTVRSNPIEALREGVSETWFVISETLHYVGGMFAGRESTDQLGGPIRVAQVSGQVATLGFGALLNLAAILSVSIGLINLFPVPLLDGGHLLYYAIEAVRGRPLPERVQDYGFRVGFMLVIVLMMFTTWNDILHLAGS